MMLADWLSVLPIGCVALALLFAPGLGLGLVLNLRGLWLWALAPAISLTLYAAGSLALPIVGIRWSPVSSLAFAIIFAGLIFLLFRFVLRSRFQRPEVSWRHTAGATFVALGTSAVVLVTWLVIGIGTPENISQTFDNIFHLNAIAYIGDSGDASSFAIGKLIVPGSDGGFYPVVWHSMVSLVAQLTGASVAVAINGFNLAVAATVWPLGVLLLVRQFTGPSRSALLFTGVFAAAFPAFPMNMLYFGVLYPYFLGLALVPGVVAVVLQLTGVTQDFKLGAKPALTVLLLGLVPGMALSHPVAMMTVLAFSVPIVLVATFASWSGLTNRTKVWRILGLAIYGAVGLAMLYKLRPGVMWDPRTSTLDSLWRTFSLELGGYGLPIVLAGITLLGIVIALRAKSRVGAAAVGIWVVIASLHFVVAGVTQPILRGVTGVWYGDTPRLEAVMPIAVIPLAVLGAEWLYGKTSTLSSAIRNSMLAGGLLVLLVVTQIGSGYAKVAADMSKSYTTSDSSVLLSTDERKLLDRLAEETAPDEMIVGSPWTGTSLAYAFADREVLMPHILMQTDAARDEILAGLRYADKDPAVCDAVNSLNARWFLDFGAVEVHGAEHVYPGFKDIGRTDVVELVDREGGASLYRIVACG